MNKNTNKLRHLLLNSRKSVDDLDKHLKLVYITPGGEPGINRGWTIEDLERGPLTYKPHCAADPEIFALAQRIFKKFG